MVNHYLNWTLWLRMQYVFLLLFFFCFGIYKKHITISCKTARAHLSGSVSDSSLELVCFSSSICELVNSFQSTASLSGLLLAL